MQPFESHPLFLVLFRNLLNEERIITATYATLNAQPLVHEYQIVQIGII